MTEIVLKLKDIHKSFGSTKIINGLNLDIYDGEVFTLLGPSGCGKSTTLRIVAGLEEPDNGEVIFKEKPWVMMSKDIVVPAYKRNVGVVFQNYAIWPHMTAFENVAYPLKVRGEKKNDIKKKVNEILRVVGLEGYEDRPATMLSGGQQQRVSIARCLVYEPGLLLLDEPFSNLDANLRERMRLEVRQLQQKLKLTVIFVTHDHLDAFTLSDRIGIMRNGKIEQIDNSLNIYGSPESSFIRDFVGNNIKFTAVLAEVNDNQYKLRLTNNTILGFDKKQAIGEFKCGDKVEVSYRPEDVLVNNSINNRADSDYIECVIESVMYLGDSYQCTIQLDLENKITVKMHKDDHPKIMDRVFIKLDPLKSRLWEVSK